jgi:hypothetical protein
MKQFVAITAFALAAGCAAQSPERVAEMRADSEAELAAQLDGYQQSGPAVSCVSQRNLRGNRAAGDDAIIFTGSTSGTLYVNRPAAGCPELKFGRALVVRTTSSQLCRGDIATVIDPVNGIGFGGCGLGEFTPYRRMRTADAGG